jgi:cobalt-zinc-cadmium efflux system outer membrane protein
LDFSMDSAATRASLAHSATRACAATRLCAALTLGFGLAAGAPAAAQDDTPSPAEGAREVSLAELLAHAEQHAGSLRVAEARRGFARAAQQAASPLLRDDPTLEFAIGPRFGASSGNDFDFVASLAQPVEVAGQRGLRVDAANRLELRLGAEAEAARWELRRQVTLAFHAARLAREAEQQAARTAELAATRLGTTARRMSAGEVNLIELRLAEVEDGRARQAQLSCAQRLVAARLRLAEVSGWSVEAPPNVPEGLEPPGPVPTLAELMKEAATRHPALRAQAAAVDQAAAQMGLAEREVWPTPVFGVQVAREGSAGSPANYIVLGTLGLELPLWNRNRRERATTQVELEVQRVEQSATARAVAVRLAQALADVEATSQRLTLFAASLGPKLEEGLVLLQRAFEAGELGLGELTVAQERFLSARQERLYAYADYYQARTELEYALGAELPVAAGGAP